MGIFDRFDFVIKNGVLINYKGKKGDIKIPGNVTEIAEGAFKSENSLENYLYRVWIPDSVEKISDNAFYGQSRLEDVRFPARLKEIGRAAFSLCGLRKADIPSGVKSIGSDAFFACRNMEAVSFPENLEEIGNGAFRSCTALKEVILPANLKVVESFAFSECDSLERVYIPASVEYIGESCFSECPALKSVEVDEDNEKYCFKNGCLIYKDDGTLHAVLGCRKDTVIPPEPDFIGCSAFKGNEEIENLVISEGVEYIGRDAFALCYNLASVSFPSSLKRIGDSAFERCSSLEEVEIKGDLEEIESRAFFRCESLQTVILPQGLRTIGDHAFFMCKALTSVTIPDAVAEIGENAFEGCTALRSLVVPESVVTIGKYAFKGSGLRHLTIPETFKGEESKLGISGDCEITFSHISNPNDFYIRDGVVLSYAGQDAVVTIPNGVDTIGSYSFGVRDFGKRNCLKKIRLHSGIVKIGENAFANCTGIAEMDVPDSVVEIGDKAFRNCTSLRRVTLPVSFKGHRYRLSIPESCDVLFRGYEDDLNAIEEASFEDFEINNGVLIKYNGNATELTVPRGAVNAIGEGAFRDNHEIRIVVIPEGVKSIGKGVFARCFSLEQVIIPESVETIGDSAFSECYSLRSIKLPAGFRSPEKTGVGSNIESMLFRCGNLKSIAVSGENPLLYVDGNCLISRDKKILLKGCADSVIPADVTEIGRSAFSYCRWLERADIPCGVRVIGSGAFYACSGLEHVNIPDSVTEIGGEAFFATALREVFVPDSVRTIGKDAFWSRSLEDLSLPLHLRDADIGFVGSFRGEIVEDVDVSSEDDFDVEDDVLVKYCGSETDVVIPKGLVRVIGPEAFLENCDIRSVTIPEGVEHIDYSAFSGCGELQNIILPEGLLSIGDSAFKECALLKKLIIPASVECIGCCNSESGKRYTGWCGTDVFEGCFSLDSIEVKAGNKYFCSINGSLIEKENNILVRGNRHGIISGIKEIAENAYSGLGIKEAIIPVGVTEIGYYAFAGCEELKKVIIPSTVKSIGTEAFHYCIAVEEIYIASGVKTIDDDSFEGCKSLASLTIPDSVQTISGVFSVEGPKRIVLPEKFRDLKIRTNPECMVVYENVFVPDQETDFAGKS